MFTHFLPNNLSNKIQISPQSLKNKKQKKLKPETLKFKISQVKIKVSHEIANKEGNSVWNHMKDEGELSKKGVTDTDTIQKADGITN